MFNGSVEDLINSLEIAIEESLKYFLSLSLSGKPPPFHLAPKYPLDEKPIEAKASHVKMDIRGLPPITESFEAKQTSSLFAWTFQHVSQVIELTLRILLTKQIEECLTNSKSAELKASLLINFLQKNEF